MDKIIIEAEECTPEISLKSSSFNPDISMKSGKSCNFPVDKRKLSTQEESLDILHSSIRDGEEMIDNLVKQVDDFYHAIDIIREHLCAGEICSENCDNFLHCHNLEHHKLHKGAYCLEPVTEK